MENCSSNCGEIRTLMASSPESLCIVGYGNRERRDDGVGPWVVEGLRNQALPSDRVRLLVRPQLDPDLLDELSQADTAILVDASVERLEGGISWTRVDPAKGQAPFLTHSLEPAYLLGLMALMHPRLPATWLVSIQGEEFGYGQGLSRPTEERARQVIADLVKIVAEEERI